MHFKDHTYERHINPEDLEGEKWYDIPEWEGRYQISNKRRIKSLERTATYPDGHTRVVPEKIFTPDTVCKFNRDGVAYSYGVKHLMDISIPKPKKKNLFKLDLD